MMFLCCLILLTVSCNNGVRKDVQQNILSHKEFIRQLAIDGVILQRIYCDKCNFNKYQFKVKLNTASEKVNLGYMSFPPYYTFLNNKEIMLSVNKELYDAGNEGTPISKPGGSINVTILEESYKLLSEEKYTWIPQHAENL